VLPLGLDGASEYTIREDNAGLDGPSEYITREDNAGVIF
jgi:hypothetical protein